MENLPYSINKAKLGDEETLAYIQTESGKAAFQTIMDKQTLDKYTVPEKTIAMYRRILEQNFGNGYILSIEGVPHCIAWWSDTREKEMPGYAEIICIHSLPNHWGEGYGSKMMARLLADIASAGYSRVMLWVFTENKRARKFYESQGFYATDNVQNKWEVPEIRYERVL